MLASKSKITKPLPTGCCMETCDNSGAKIIRIFSVKRAKTVKEIKNTLQSYMVLGYKTMPRLQKDSYVLDVIKGHLGRGQSGRLFQEIRVKHGLAYDVGIMHDPNADYGFFSAYIGTHKKNLQKCKNIILSEFNKLQDMTIGELYDAKKFIQGEYILDNEENFRFADTLAFFTMASKPRKAFDYIKDIESKKSSCKIPY